MLSISDKRSTKILDSNDYYILMAGQSNLNNYYQEVTDSLPEYLKKTYDRVRVHDGSSYIKLVAPDDFVHSVVPLANRFERLSDGNMYAEVEGYGGRSMYPHPDEPDFAVSSNELIVNVKAALTRLKAQAGSNPNAKFVFLWNQGEDDAGRSISTEDYLTEFEAMIDELELIQSFDLILINLLQNKSTGSANIRAAHVQYVSENAKAIGNDLQRYSFGPDEIHYIYPALEDYNYLAMGQIINYFR